MARKDKARVIRFPCYLWELLEPDQLNQWHAYIEYRGCRYYMGTFARYQDAESVALKCQDGACAYVTDRSESFISGGATEYAAALQSRGVDQ
jgi:hypothetical protein